MNTNELINWQTFKSKLQDNPELTLQFQYAENKWVDASYHITEIKQAPIVSVDCGGIMNTWTEIIVQLWEPSVRDNERAMKISKALSIIELVEKSLPLNPMAVVKIEFGNSQFDTRQMYPGEFIVDDENFVVNLNPDFTQCKAINRGESCGSEETVSCTPGGGCC
nr:DUF6428 family protein [Pedobacter panaciterrae]